MILCISAFGQQDLSKIWFEKGNESLNNGSYENAIKAFEKAIEFNSNYAEAWNYKGLAQLRNGTIDSAVDSFEKATECDPNYAIAWGNVGYALLQKNDPKNFDEALQAYNRSIEANPKLKSAWFSRGMLLLHIARFNESIQSLDKALEIDRNLTAAWFGKALALEKMDRNEEAADALVEVYSFYWRYDSNLEFAIRELMNNDTRNVSDTDEVPLMKKGINQVAAAKYLGKKNDSRALDPLNKALNDSKSIVREAAAKAIEKIKVDKIDKTEVDNCIEDLKITKSDSATKQLKLICANRLGDLKDPRATESLIDVVLNENDSRIRSEAERALGKINDSRAVNCLILSLNDSNYDVRESAIIALGEISDPRATIPLIRSSGHEDMYFGDLISKIKEALINIGQPSVDPLIQALRDENPEVRNFAAWTLGDLKDPKSVQPLIQALKDKMIDDAQVSGALIAIGKPAVVPLIQALNDDDKDVRSNATWILGHFGNNTNITDFLINILNNDPEGDVRGTAAMALGWLKNKDAVEPLIQALNDSDSSVRDYAIKALIELNDPRAVGPISLSLNDDNQKVREAAAEALKELKIPSATSIPMQSSEIDESGDNLGKLLGDGYSYFINGNYNKALISYDRATELDPSSEKAWIGRGKALCALGKLDEGFQSIDKAINLNTSNGQNWVEKAGIHAAYDEYDKAIECMDKAIVLDGSNVEYRYIKGKIFFLQSNYDKTIECCDEAIKLDPSYSKAWVKKAIALKRLGKYEEALEYVEKGTQLDPDRGDNWHVKGTILQALGKYSQADIAFQQEEKSPSRTIGGTDRGIEAWY